MIRSLHISNYALIDEVDISFGPGLNIITGETGAGKSIMLGALGLLLGERVDSRAVRNNDKRTVIEAEFSVDSSMLEAYCRQNDLEWDPERIILRREIAPNGGRSRAFVNDSPVTLDHLRNVAITLVDIHSQHQNQLLASHDFQLNIIDVLAGNGELLEQMSATYDEFLHARRVFKDTRAEIERSRADAEFMAFQLEQLNQFNPQPGEQEALERERDLLSNISTVKEHLYDASQLLDQGAENALAKLQSALDDITSLNDVLDDAEALANRLNSAIIEISDIASTVAEYDTSTNADPQRLQEVEDRLNTLYSLQRKHNVETDAELAEIRDNLTSRLAAIDDSDSILDSLAQKCNEAKARAIEIASRLTTRRQGAAEELAKRLILTATPLGMSNLRCEIKIESSPLRRSGGDEVQFLFAFNKNQPLMPVGGKASGGEISRLMLCIKSILAESMQLPTIIFDEIDTGVSGDIASRMGRMMAQIGTRMQVVAITHLPTVAALGSRHFKVYKEDSADNTFTRLRTLDTDERRHELALMLSGNPDDPAALATADSLMAT